MPSILLVRASAAGPILLMAKVVRGSLGTCWLPTLIPINLELRLSKGSLGELTELTLKAMLMLAAPAGILTLTLIRTLFCGPRFSDDEIAPPVVASSI